MKFHEKQIEAIEATKDDKIKTLFITGEGGTGKSEIIKHITQNTLSKDVVLLAPTQSAAENIDGETLHSFFKIKPVVNLMADKESDVLSFDLEDLDPDLVNGKTVIIDEVSMLGESMLMNVMQRITPKKLILFGDPEQLDPIKEKKVCWKSFAQKTILLTHNYRISDPLVKKVVTQYRAKGTLPKEVDRIKRINGTSFNPDTIYIAHTNKSLSDMQKALLGYSNAKRDDILLTFGGCDKNIGKIKEKKGKKDIVPYFSNNDLVRVLNVRQYMTYNLYMCEVITLDNRQPDLDKFLQGARVMVGDYDMYTKIVKDRFAKARDFQKKMFRKYKVKGGAAFHHAARKCLPDIHEFKSYWRSYFEIKNCTYARHSQFRTVYKCQGKGFKSVVIDWNNLPSRDHRYVALSRATDSIKIIAK